MGVVQAIAPYSLAEFTHVSGVPAASIISMIALMEITGHLNTTRETKSMPEFDVVDRIRLTYDSDQWRSLVDTFRFHKKGDEFLDQLGNQQLFKNADTCDLCWVSFKMVHLVVTMQNRLSCETTINKV